MGSLSKRIVLLNALTLNKIQVRFHRPLVTRAQAWRWSDFYLVLGPYCIGLSQNFVLRVRQTVLTLLFLIQAYSLIIPRIFQMAKPLIAVAVISVAVAIGLGLSYATTTPQTVQVIDLPLPVFVCLLSFAIQWMAAIPSLLLHTEKHYDLTGSLTFLAVLGVACGLASGLDIRCKVLVVMVALWAARLGSYLFYRAIKNGGDRRFDEIKKSPFRLLTAWTLQGLWVFYTALPALTVIWGTHRVEMDTQLYIGVGVWLVGIGIELVSDYQKHVFVGAEGNRGKFINVGLWRWSRHPNYFGQILLWVGVTIVAIPTLQGWQWVVLSSPVFVAVLICFVSGIPPTEKRAEEKFGSQTDFQRYKAVTPVLVPCPPSSDEDYKHY